MAVTIDELTVADAPERWAALGFVLDGDVCVVGGVRIRLAGRGEDGEEGAAAGGLRSWSLRGLSGGVGEAGLDGLPTTTSERPPPDRPPAHPNGITGVDHVVAITPALERTVAALEGAGLDLRRIREEPTPAGAPRQAFFRLGATILEVVQEPDDVVESSGGADRPAFFWGLAFAAPEIEATAAAMGDGVSEVRPAVQPGRRIATLSRTAGLSLPVALITPR